MAAAAQVAGLLNPVLVSEVAYQDRFLPHDFHPDRLQAAVAPRRRNSDFADELLNVVFIIHNTQSYFRIDRVDTAGSRHWSFGTIIWPWTADHGPFAFEETEIAESANKHTIAGPEFSQVFHLSCVPEACPEEVS